MSKLFKNGDDELGLIQFPSWKRETAFGECQRVIGRDVDTGCYGMRLYLEDGAASNSWHSVSRGEINEAEFMLAPCVSSHVGSL